MVRQPFRGREWLASDRTDGPLDIVLDRLRDKFPDLVVERLTMPHPGDDDNVYFVGLGDRLDIVQVDTAVCGEPPFVIEASERRTTTDPLIAIEIVGRWLIDE